MATTRKRESAQTKKTTPNGFANGARLTDTESAKAAAAMPKRNSANSKSTNDEASALPDMQGGHDEFRHGQSSDLGNTHSAFPREEVTRRRWILPLGDGGPSSLVIPAKIAFTQSILRDSTEFHAIPYEVGFLRFLHENGIGPDLIIADDSALPRGEEWERLVDHVCASPNMPIFVGDPNSEFARRVPPAQFRRFPKTLAQVDDIVFQMFWGPPPVADLTLQFYPVLDRLPDITSPIEFTDYLEFLHPEQYADVLQSLRGCKDARGILRWKLLDILGDLLLDEEIFNVRADVLPLGDRLNYPIVKTLAQQ